MPQIPQKIVETSQIIDAPRVVPLRSEQVFFNEIKQYPVQWLENLFPGNVVDDRSISLLTRQDVVDYKRVHFFAGIGGWEYALQLAGWSIEEPVWTGSCPCQPFSVAGKQQGEKDERHLWPEMCRLIGECLPSTIFGEQVAGKLGLEWLDGVCTDLEALGYAVAAVVLPAGGVGAPHRRYRIYWVAYASSNGRTGTKNSSERKQNTNAGVGISGVIHDAALQQSSRNVEGKLANGKGQGIADDAMSSDNDSAAARRLADTNSIERNSTQRSDWWRTSKLERTDIDKPWNRSDWIDCSDGKRRRIPTLEQGICPLASRVPGDVEQIEAYGNAIVPQVAAVFIRSFLEARRCL